MPECKEMTEVCQGCSIRGILKAWRFGSDWRNGSIENRDCIGDLFAIRPAQALNLMGQCAHSPFAPGKQ